MSHTVSIDQASKQLRGLVGSLGPDDEIVLTDNNLPIARIVRDTRVSKRLGGSWKGKLIIHVDSDDPVLEHFKD